MPLPKDEMNLQKYAEILDGIRHDPCDHYPYRNRKGASGYETVFKVEEFYFWYAVTGAKGVVSPREVAQAIREGIPKPPTPFKDGGFGQKVQYQGKWYLVHRGSEKPCKPN